jgi:hypothetical protein
MDEPASRLALGCLLAHENPIGLSAGAIPHLQVHRFSPRTDASSTSSHSSLLRHADLQGRDSLPTRDQENTRHTSLCGGRFRSAPGAGRAVDADNDPLRLAGARHARGGIPRHDGFAAQGRSEPSKRHVNANHHAIIGEPGPRE